MNILFGCEESQEGCKAFRRLDFNTYSCDLKPCSGGHPEWHIIADVLMVVKGGTFKTQAGTYVTIARWDMAVFFPDCTYLTCSAEWAYKDGPYHQKVKPGTLVGTARRQARAAAYEFFMALWNCGIEYVGIENPVGVMSRYFRKPDQIVQPYQFGNDASKATCLWLKGLPVLQTNSDYYVWPRTVCQDCKRSEVLPTHVKIQLLNPCFKCGGKVFPRWANQTDSGQNNLSPSDNRAEQRSKSYPGIMDAMAIQWGHFLQPCDCQKPFGNPKHISNTCKIHNV